MKHRNRESNKIISTLSPRGTKNLVKKKVKMMKTMLIALLALATAFAFVTGAMAQQTSSPAPAASTSTPAASSSTSTPAPAAKMTTPKMEKFNGVIAKVDQANKEVVVQFHKEKMTFWVDTSTKLMEGKKPLSFDHLKKGMWASVQYSKEGNKAMVMAMNVSMPKALAKKEESIEKTTEMKAPAAKTPAASPAPTSEKK
jgi:hypothetical protein